MKHTIKLLFILLSLSLFLQACSSTPLQRSRLNEAEDHLVSSEQALAASKISAAESYLGTATAYLATLQDFKKSLSLSEEKKLEVLLQREKRLSQAIKIRK